MANDKLRPHTLKSLRDSMRQYCRNLKDTAKIYGTDREGRYEESSTLYEVADEIDDIILGCRLTLEKD